MLENKILPNVEKRNYLTACILRVLIDAIKQDPNKYGFKEAEEEITEDKKIEIETAAEELSGVIGRIALTKNTPATPYSFHFWLTRDPRTEVEPGEFVVVPLSMSNADKTETALAVVESIQSLTDLPDPLTHHYSWAFGSPEEEMPTEIPVVRIAKASIVYRTDGKSTPFIGPYPIRKSSASDLKKVFDKIVRPENRVLLGFVKDGYGVHVPVFGDFRYIFGYEAGHVNITGKSGVAGKTTYALFLIATVLGYIKQYSQISSNFGSERTLGIIAFNVKEKDLLTLENIPYDNIDAALEAMSQKEHLQESADMWQKCRELGIDPVEIFRGATTFWGIYSGQKYFSYGLQDILERGIYTFISLFSPEDINEQMESLIYSIADEFGDKRSSFTQMIAKLTSKLSSTGGSQVYIGGTPHHPATISKFLNRMRKIIDSSLVIDANNPYGKPIDIQDLSSEELWIIDIKPLRDFEQRMMFFSILSDLNKILEAKKEGKKGISVRGEFVELTDFPSRVCVYVDELNKFAPAGRTSSPIKTFIIDITSRGRSIGLTLLGAQQFASQIDEEVLGNTSTYVIGKSEALELSNRFYKRIPEGLRDRIPYLKAGEAIIVHEIHDTPFVIKYPIRLDKIET